MELGLQLIWDVNTSCLSYLTVTGDCSPLPYHTPMCSSVISSLPDTKYFITINNPFTNYFNHETQEQAVYELSKHARLIHLLITQQPNINSTNEVTQCLNDVRFLLCNLYLPRCGDRFPKNYPISSTQCKITLEKNCSSAILQLRNRGYSITWPPVTVDCKKFTDSLSLSGEDIRKYWLPLKNISNTIAYTISYSTLPCLTPPYHTILHLTISYSTLPCHTSPYHIILHLTISYSTRQQ